MRVHRHTIRNETERYVMMGFDAITSIWCVYVRLCERLHRDGFYSFRFAVVAPLLKRTVFNRDRGAYTELNTMHRIEITGNERNAIIVDVTITTVTTIVLALWSLLFFNLRRFASTKTIIHLIYVIVNWLQELNANNWVESKTRRGYWRWDARMVVGGSSEGKNE